MLGYILQLLFTGCGLCRLLREEWRHCLRKIKSGPIAALNMSMEEADLEMLGRLLKNPKAG